MVTIVECTVFNCTLTDDPPDSPPSLLAYVVRLPRTQRRSSCSRRSVPPVIVHRPNVYLENS
jgi:hypothetical protein